MGSTLWHREWTDLMSAICKMASCRTSMGLSYYSRRSPRGKTEVEDEPERRMAHSKHSRNTPSWLSHAVKILNPDDCCRCDVVHSLGLHVIHKTTTVACLVILNCMHYMGLHVHWKTFGVETIFKCWWISQTITKKQHWIKWNFLSTKTVILLSCKTYSTVLYFEEFR